MALIIGRTAVLTGSIVAGPRSTGIDDRQIASDREYIAAKIQQTAGDVR